MRLQFDSDGIVHSDYHTLSTSVSITLIFVVTLQVCFTLALLTSN